jgi:nucleoside-diphosphate-sugar epimerase
MQTILGAGGAVAVELVKELGAVGERIRLVGRNPKAAAGAAEVVAADISDLDQTVKAVAGSNVVYLVVGLKYDWQLWRDLWPPIMANTIEACKRARAKLVFFDNVYMYGKVRGAMTEETPFNPCSRKGEIRAAIANTLLAEIKAGKLTAMIARAADFYGPGAKTGIPNVLVFDKFVKKSRALCLVNDSTKHSYTYVPDAAKSLVMLARNANAWNQTWHLPTRSNPPTSREFIGMAAQEFKCRPAYWTLSRPMVKMAGWFDPTIREVYEMLYQNDSDYLFDSTKFSKAVGFEPTSYSEGIKRTATSYSARS